MELQYAKTLKKEHKNTFKPKKDRDYLRRPTSLISLLCVQWVAQLSESSLCIFPYNIKNIEKNYLNDSFGKKQTACIFSIFVDSVSPKSILIRLRFHIDNMFMV